MTVLANYADLQTALLAWVNLSTNQAGVTSARVEEAVKFAEAAMGRVLRSYEAQTSVTGSTSTANGITTIALPDDWLAGKDVELLVDGSTYVPLQDLGGSAVVQAGDARIEIRPSLVQDLDFRLRYWARFTSIAGVSGGANWLLLAHPDAYLTGSKMWLHRFMLDAEAAALEESRFKDILAQLRESSISREWFNVPTATYGAGTP